MRTNVAAAATGDQHRAAPPRRGDGGWLEAPAQGVLVRASAADADCREIAAAPPSFGSTRVNNSGTDAARQSADMDAVSARGLPGPTYAVKVAGAFQMVRASGPRSKHAPQPGAAVMTARSPGVTGIGSSVPYAASKGALNT